MASCKTADEKKRTAEIIRPILRGRDIKQYGHEWAGLYLIYIPWHFPYQFDPTIQGASKEAEEAFKEQYPSVYSHMLQYKVPLSKRNKAETGIRYEWYAMQRWGAKYWDDFNKPKICWASVGDTSYSLVPEKYLLLDTNYFFSTDNPSELLAILNSKLITWWIKSEDTQLGSGGAWRHYKYNLEKLHVPKTDNLFHDLIENIIINHKLLDSMYKINHIVYDLYHLTDEEIMYIEDKER